MIKVRVNPTHEECEICLLYPLNKSASDCNNCWRRKNSYNLFSFVQGFFTTQAILEKDGKFIKVPYHRIEVISEEENEN